MLAAKCRQVQPVAEYNISFACQTSKTEILDILDFFGISLGVYYILCSIKCASNSPPTKSANERFCNYKLIKKCYVTLLFSQGKKITKSDGPKYMYMYMYINLDE